MKSTFGKLTFLAIIVLYGFGGMTCDEKGDRDPCDGIDSCGTDTCPPPCDTATDCSYLSMTEWTVLGLEGQAVTPIAFHPTDERIIYVGTGSSFSDSTAGVLYKSTNCGRTWDTVLVGFIYGGGFTDVKIDPTNPDVLYAGRHEYLKSTDGGTTWDPIVNGMQIDLEQRARELVIDPQNPSILLASVGGFGVGRIYRSTDAGQNWQDVTGITDDVSSLLFHPFQPDTVYAGGTLGILKSTNRGLSWFPTEFWNNGITISQILAYGNNPIVLYAAARRDTSTSGVYSSTNGGGQWYYHSYVPDSHRSFRALTITGGVLYAGTETGCYFYDGNNWVNMGISTYVRDIQIDKSGSWIFVGTSFQGLNARRLK